MTTESREQDPGSARASRKSRGSPAIIEAGGSGGRDFDAETLTVERIYRLADALKAAERALDEVPTVIRGGRADLDALLDKPLYPGDFDFLAKSVREIADAWQSDIDAEDGQ